MCQCLRLIWSCHSINKNRSDAGSAARCTCIAAHSRQTAAILTDAMEARQCHTASSATAPFAADRTNPDASASACGVKVQSACQQAVNVGPILGHLNVVGCTGTHFKQTDSLQLHQHAVYIELH